MTTTKDELSPLRAWQMVTTLSRVKDQEALNLGEQATLCTC